jgi:beta-glucanase (GH16 family)
METIKWSGREWLTRETWGIYHPEKDNVWYDRSAIEVSGNGNLHLRVHKNPRHFDGKFIETGIGLISSADDFQYGHFEIECRLPAGKHLWPAFWTWGRESWPPEVDILEGYTKAGSSYLGAFFNAFSVWNVQTNAHFGSMDDGTKGSTGAMTHWFGLRNPARNFIKYKMSWYPDKIVLFFNGNEVRKITDTRLLGQMNKQPSRVIINNNAENNNWTSKSDFVIKYFRYTAL